MNWSSIALELGRLSWRLRGVTCSSLLQDTNHMSVSSKMLIRFSPFVSCGNVVFNADLAHTVRYMVR